MKTGSISIVVVVILQLWIVDAFLHFGNAASTGQPHQRSSKVLEMNQAGQEATSVNQEVSFVEYELNARGKGTNAGTRQVLKADLSTDTFRAVSIAMKHAKREGQDESTSNLGESNEESENISSRIDGWKNSLANNFIPSGDISPDYFTYTKWRCMQRFVAGTSSVFGTQALVMALGVKSNKALGIAAGTMWVMKDALGKVSRILWASNYGRKFDQDSKKWRFRSSIIFATGSLFEILTYLRPQFFLYIAAAANALKQMSMLTSSATRNTIYKSFARNSDNIGDVTAKGEAQIAIVDLLGMAAGIWLSKFTNLDRWKMIGAFLSLSLIDLYCIFNEIRSVVFHKVNFERAGRTLKHFNQRGIIAPSVPAEGGPPGVGGAGDRETGIGGALSQNPYLNPSLSPSEVASVERIFWSTRMGEGLFTSWSGLQGVSNVVLRNALQIFKTSPIAPPFIIEEETNTNIDEEDKERSEAVVMGRWKDKINSHRFLVTCEAHIPSRMELFFCRNGLGTRSLGSILRSIPIDGPAGDPYHSTGSTGLGKHTVPVLLRPQVLLHKDARSIDIFRSLVCVHRLLHDFEQGSLPYEPRSGTAGAVKQINRLGKTTAVLARHGLDEEGLVGRLQRASDYERAYLPAIMQALHRGAWDMTAFAFGVITKRVDF